MPAPAHRPVLIAHTAGHMAAAFAAAKAANAPAQVRSAPGAAATLGAGVFAAMVDTARTACPDADIVAVLDCAEDAGAAMNAIRLGLPAVRIAAPADILKKISDMAEAAGVTLDTNPSPPLDLLGEPDAEAAATAWIQTTSETGLLSGDNPSLGG